MKILPVFLFCFAVFNGLAQTADIKVEEKSSEWIKVTAVTTTSKPKTTSTVKKQTSTSKPPAARKDEEQEFEKTNNQVNRFKKQQKG